MVPALISLLRLWKTSRDRKPGPLQPPPFFILGSGRNGSTLLASILNNHKDIFIPPEAYVLPYAIMRWKIMKGESVQDFCDFVVDELKRRDVEPKWALGNMTGADIIVRLPSERPVVQEVFDALYRLYGESLGKPFTLWGDKTPMLTHFVDYIYPEVPGAKYIFLIRDPRDVVLSYSKMKDHLASDPRYAIWKWNDSVRSYDFLKQKTKVLLIKYEDLATSSEEVLKKTQEFLGVELIHNIAEQPREAGLLNVQRLSHLGNITNPINAGSVHNWRGKLSPEMIKMINSGVGSRLARFGYPEV